MGRISLIGLVGLMVFGGSSAQAAETPRAGVQVSPLSVEREVRPGEEFFFAVKFFNPLDYSQNIRPKFKDIAIFEDAISNWEAGVRFLDYSSPRYTVSRWSDFAKEVIILGPHEEVTLEVGIKVPEDAVPGGHFGAFFGEVRASESNSKQTLKQVQGDEDSNVPDGKSGSPLGYRVGQTVAAGTLVFLSVLGEGVGDADWIGDLSEFSVEGKSLGGFLFTSEPISFRTIFVNKGIFHQNVWGGLSIRNVLGGGVDNFRLQEKKALPASYVAYSQPWEPKLLPVGKYEAQLEFLYGRNGEETATKAISFWVVDPKAFVVLGVIAVAVVSVFVRRDRIFTN